MSIIRLFSSGILFFVGAISYGQSIELISDTDMSPISYLKTNIDNPKYENPHALLEPIIERLINDNYLEANIDSILSDSTQKNHKAYIHLGEKYSFEKITIDSLGLDFLSKLKLSPPRSTQEYLNIREQIKDYYGNRGFPFCKIVLDDMQINDNNLEGKLSINTGPKIIIDSINIQGDLKIKTHYIRRYLDFDNEEVYNHKKLLGIPSQLNKLAFLKQSQSPDLNFFHNYSTLNLYLDPKNASRFDFLIGIIPTNNLDDQQLFLSLDFTAEMLNRFGYGEYLYIDFERLRPEQQKFELKFNYPYMFDLPFGINAEFSLFRNALEYSTLKADLGVQYFINSNDHLKVSWDYESSSLIDIDTAQLYVTQRLPQDLDVDQTGIAAELSLARLDYQYNPRSGYDIRIKGVAGQRTIKKNPIIFQLTNDPNERVDFTDSYDTLQLKTPRFELSGDLSYFKPLASRATIGLSLKAGWRYSKAGLYRNEKFQIGGNQILRGFDEASFFTSYYAISTVEYRLLLSNNSYFSLPFVDFGYLENTSGQAEYALGIGGSLGIETKVGLFNFTIAVGRTQEIDFDLGRPKAHFGFVSLF